MKHKLLLQHCGENATTSHEPVAAVLSQEGDLVTARWPNGKTDTVNLNEEKTVCMAWDWDMLTKIRRWELGEQDLPDWMSVDEFLINQVAWKYYLGFGANPDWPRGWFHRLIKLGENAKYAAIQLLKVKSFRSGFRASLREQLEGWLNDPQPKYASPFSPRQWEAILNRHVCLAARRTASSLYWRR
jgi:hypothetical protein